MTPDLEDIGKIGLEHKAQVDRVGSVVEVPDCQPFVTGGLPQKLGAHDVDGVAGQNERAAIKEVGVGEIGGQHVVVLNRRAQEEPASPVDEKMEPGQKPGVLVEQTLRARIGGNDVAVMVEHREGVAVFQRPRTAFLQGRGSGYIEPRRVRVGNRPDQGFAQ